MLQSLLRNWLLGQAHQKVQEAARHAAAQTAAQAQSAAEQSPPEPPPRPVCHVGMVFALGIEAGGLVDRLSGAVRTDAHGFVAREGGLDGQRLVLVECGVGAEPAARATQALIQGHEPRWIVSAGFAGGLDERLAVGDIVMIDEVIGTDDRLLRIDFKLGDDAVTQRRLHVGRLLTIDRIVRDADEKRALARRYGALAADMETLAVAEVCRREKIRFLAVRVISDTLESVMPPEIEYLMYKKSTAGRLGAAAGAILRRPSAIKDLWQLKEDGLVASERLATFLVGVIGQLR